MGFQRFFRIYMFFGGEIKTLADSPVSTGDEFTAIAISDSVLEHKVTI